MLLLRSFCLTLLLLASPVSHSLEIVFENRVLDFPDLYISGINHIAASQPDQNRLHVVRFHVEGIPGRRINVSVPGSQYLRHATQSRSLKIGKILYGCGLSSKGKATITNTGKSNLLCIGAQVRISQNDLSGIYSASIPLEVNY